MGIVARQSLANSLNNYAGIFLGTVNTIFLFPYIYGAAIMGQVNTVIAYGTIFSSLGHLGLPHALVKFFPGLAKADRARFMSLSLLFLTFSGVLFALALLLFVSYRPEKEYYIYVIPLGVGMLFFELYAGLSQSVHQSNHAELVRNVYRRLLVSIGLGLAWWFSWEVRYFWLWLAIGYLLQIALIVYLLRRDLPPLRRPSRGELDWPKMFRYSLLLTLTGSAMILVSKIDIIMIENMIGPEEVAFYFLAFFIAKFITTPGRSLVTGMRGSVAQAWKKNDLDLLSTIYQKSAAYQTLSTTFLFLGVALFYPFLELFMKAEFQGLYALFFWLGLGQWVTTSSGINAMIIALSNRYQWNFYVNIALLIITPVLNLLLIPQFGLLGAAVATFVSLTITNILRFWMVKKLFGLLPYLGSNRSLFFINILSISVAGILTAYDMPWWMRFSIMGLLVLSSFWQVQHFSIFEDLIKIFTRLGKNKT